MFYQPYNELGGDSKKWAVVFVCIWVALVWSTVRNFFFGVVGAKLVEHIRSLTFEKVVHQQINWFDDPTFKSLEAQKISVKHINSSKLVKMICSYTHFEFSGSSNVKPTNLLVYNLLECQETNAL